MINVLEKLKDTPVGTKLYSSMIGYCILDEIDIASNFITVKDYYCSPEVEPMYYTFDKFGRLFGWSTNDDMECILFPSKEDRDWSNYKYQEDD